MPKLMLLVIIPTVACQVMPGGEAGRGPRVPAEPLPLWSAELDRGEYRVGGVSRLSPRLVSSRIAFGDEHELVVLLELDAGASSITTRAFVLDAATGTLEKRLDLTGPTPARIAGTPTGYVVETPTGVTSWTLGLRSSTAKSSATGLRVSPDGRVVAIWSGEISPGHGVTRFLNPTSLESAGIDVYDTAVQSISRDRVAYTVRREGRRTASIAYRPEDNYAPIYDTECEDVSPHFVRNDAVVAIGCGLLELVTLAGNRQFVTTVGRVSGVASIARDGTRIAVYEDSYSTASPPTLASECFRVLDLRDGKEVASIPVREFVGQEHANSAAALSPNGTVVVISSDDHVRAYSVPTTGVR